MKNYKKFLNNAFNEKTYLENVGDVRIVADTDSLVPKTFSSGNIENELEETFIKDRRNNRNVYLQTRAKLFFSKSLLIYLPITLMLSTALVWFGPKGVKTKKLDRYQVTSTILENGEVKTIGNQEYIYNPSDYDLVDKSIQTISSKDDELVYYLQGETSGIKASFKVENDGNITLKNDRYGNEIKEGFYVDELRKNEGETNSSQSYNVYESLFDDVYNYLVTNNLVTKTQKQKIEQLNSEDKTKIVIYLTEHNYKTTEETKIYNHRWAWRIILSVITLIYTIVLGCAISEDDVEYDEWPQIKNNNGYLREINTTSNTLFNLVLKYKKELVQAEKDRIKNGIDIAHQQGVTDEEMRKILTKFETTYAEEQGYIKKLTK